MKLVEQKSPSEPPVTTIGMSGKRSVRERVLCVLFALSLAWTLLSLEMVYFGEGIGRPDPAQEGSLLHTLVEYSPGFVAVAIAGILTSFLIRLIPGFLNVPRHVTSLRLWCTLLVAFPIVGLGLLLVLIVVTAIMDPPGPHPENVQYIPPVFWFPALVGAVMTPVASVLSAWWWTVRKVSRPRRHPPSSGISARRARETADRDQ